MSSNIQNVVIVGGGTAGVVAFNAVAAKLANDSTKKIILVSPNPYHTHLPGCIRMVVTAEGSLEDINLMPYPESFNKGNKHVVLAKVTSIVDDDKDSKGRHVVLDNGETLAYSVLLLTPGSIWDGPVAFPGAKEDTLERVKTWRGRFEKANDIVIVGGGAIGTELSGELKDTYPNKNVTIVQAQDLLMNPTYPEGWRKGLTKQIEKRGVKLVLNDRVDDLEIHDGKVTTKLGKSITADLVVPVRGPRPNTKFIESLDSDVLTTEGFVKVQPTLQITGHSRIFAAGDIIEWKGEKQAVKALDQGPIAAANMVSILNGQTTGLKPYKGSPEMIIITNGKNGGASYLGILWGLTFGDWFSKTMKSKTLLVDQTKKGMGLVA